MASSSSEIAREDMLALRDMVVEGVQAGRAETVKRGLRLYAEIAEEIVILLHKYDARYDAETASREMSLLNPFRWRELEWIRDDYFRIIDKTFVDPDKAILGEVMYFPQRLAQISTRHRDQLLFSHIVREGPRYLYHLANRTDLDEPLRSFVIDRIWRFLKEFGDLQLGYHLDSLDRAEEIKQLGEIVEGVFLIFNSLSKDALTERRLEDFDAFQAAMSRILGQYVSDSRHAPMLTRSTRAGDVIDAHRRLAEEVEGLKGRIRFGLCAWILHLRKGEEHDAGIEDPRAWLDVCEGFASNIRDLTAIYVRSRTHDEQRRLHWDRWYMEEQPEGQGVQVDVDGIIDEAYAVLAVRMLANQPRQQSVEPAPALEMAAGQQDAPLWKALDRLIDEESHLLPPGAEEGAERLREIIESAVEQQRRTERERVAEAPLWEKRVDEFRNNILEGYFKAARLADYFKERDAFAVEEGSESAATPIWINILLPKKYFVEGTNTALGPFGQSFGRRLGLSIGNHALADVDRAVHTRTTPAAVWTDVEDKIQQMLSNKLSPEVLVLGMMDAREQLGEREGFQPSQRRLVISGHVGTLMDAPVQLIHGTTEPFVVVVDPEAFGKWTQFEPPFPSAPDLESHEVLGFSIQSVSPEVAEELIDHDSEEFLYNPQTNRREDRDAAKFRLCQRVHLRVAVAACVTVLDPKAIGIFQLEPEL